MFRVFSPHSRHHDTMYRCSFHSFTNYLFIHSSTHQFIHSPIYPLIHSPFLQIKNPPIHSSMAPNSQPFHPFNHFSIHPFMIPDHPSRRGSSPHSAWCDSLVPLLFIHSSSNPLLHSSIYPFNHLPTHSFINSPTKNPPIYPFTNSSIHDT